MVLPDVSINVVIKREKRKKRNSPEFPEKNDFAKRSLRVGSIPESVKDLFDGDDTSGSSRSGLPDDAVSALAQPLVDFVL